MRSREGKFDHWPDHLSPDLVGDKDFFVLEPERAAQHDSEESASGA